MPSTMPIQNARKKPTFVGFTTPCSKKMGPRPIIIVPEMVVAKMMSAPIIIGRFPTTANATMNRMPARRTCSRFLPKMPGRSRAVSFESAVKVESRVEPAVIIMMTAMQKNARMPNDSATTTGASEPLMLMFSR